MVVVDILGLIDALIWVGPAKIAKELRYYRLSRRGSYPATNPEISTGLAEDALLHAASYVADIDGAWVVECFQWPARVVRKVREYKSGGIDFGGDLAVLEGVIDGIVKLHHLPSIAEYELPQDDSDREMEKKEMERETRLDKIARNARRTTMLAGTAAYAALAYYWTPWAITPLIANNVADVAFVTVCPREDCEDPALM